MDMDVSNFDSLLVTTPVLVQCLDQLELKPEQSSGIAPLDANERFIQMPLTVLKELEAGESGRHDLNGDEGLEFTLGFNGGDQRDRCIESPFVKHVERSWAQCRDELRQHDVDELVGKRLPEDVPQRGFVRFQLCRRQNQVAVLAWLYDARQSFLSNGCVGGLLVSTSCLPPEAADANILTASRWATSFANRVASRPSICRDFGIWYEMLRPHEKLSWYAIFSPLLYS
jgi:hypothetical protein